MGFRSYIRQFLGAILMLFRPSLPWGFAAGSGSILGVAACHRSSRAGAAAAEETGGKGSYNLPFFSMGFRRSSRSSSSRETGGKSS